MALLMTLEAASRVIVLRGQVASGEGILGGPPSDFYTDLDFSNGLEHNWGGGHTPPPLNYAIVENVPS